MKAKLNLSAFGIGLSMEESSPISDIEIAVDRMLQIVKKTQKKVLIAIDEVTNTKEMRIFAGSYSTYRNRLSKSGIIDVSEYGTARFTLPRFDVFVKNYYEIY